MQNQNVTIMQDQVKDRVYDIMSSRLRLPGERSVHGPSRSLWLSSALLGVYILFASTGAPI